MGRCSWPRGAPKSDVLGQKTGCGQISQSSILSKIISAVKYARLQIAETLTSRDLTVMIGHSFGARILYTATSHVIIDEIQRQHPGFKYSSYKLMNGPSDLIILLNPAFESSIFTALHSVRRPDSDWWEAIDHQQQPILLSISTDNDYATRFAFPLGRRFELARRERQYITLGNYTPYINTV